MKFNYHFFGPIRKLIFFLNFPNLFHQTNPNFFKVKLSNKKISFSTTRMQILRHVTDLLAEVVGITITGGAGRLCFLVLVVYCQDLSCDMFYYLRHN